MSLKYGKAVAVGGISAIACASAALYWFKKRRRSKPKLRRKSPAVVSSTTTNSSNSKYARKKLKHVDKKSESSSENDDDDEDGGGGSSDSSRSPRSKDVSKNYRATSYKKNETPIGKNDGTDPVLDEGRTSKYIKENEINAYDRIESWSEEVEQVEREAEQRALKLAEEFSSQLKISNVAASTTTAATTKCTQEQITSNGVCDGEVRDVLMTQTSLVPDSVAQLLSAFSPKKHCVESPSLGSDGRSESSQDSGKGASMVLTSSMSPVEEMIEVPPMYEFEVPQDIVGLLIGRKGTTIKWFTDESGAHIVIRHHYYSDKHKICTIEGTREQINKCLRLIRHKFPPSRFPDLKLTPLLPPPIASPHSPVFDSIIHLKLPESVNCEVVLSSLVDAGHFFIQQPTHPTFPSLTRLDQYMLAVYNQPAGVPGLPRPIDVGVICAAPVLGGWYRAQTIACYDDTDEVLVKFVDYGGYSKIPATDLRQIRSDFMTLPFQATECCLAHIKPIDESEGWSSKATAFFEDCVHAKVVEALVVGHVQDNISMVELSCTIDNESVTINRVLVENGYAQWIEDE